MGPRITVIGLGYLGVTHAVCMAELGYEVLGVDVDAERVGQLSSGRVPFFEPELARMLRDQLDTGRLRCTTDYRQVAEFGDVHFLCVGTPQQADSSRADVSHLDAAVDALAPRLRRPCLVVGKSTVPVGTAERLTERVRRQAPAGADAELAWNPEFLREGRAVADTLRPDRLVLGVGSLRAETALREVYAPLIDEHAAGGPVPVITTDLATAELVKSAANAFLATKISFVNGMAEVCEAAGADVDQLASALAWDPRIGGGALRPGLGYGGGCLGKDLRALQARAEEVGAADALGFLAEVDRINQRRRDRVVSEARRLCGGSVSGKRVAVWGAAFKPDSDDVRDSPALAVASALESEGGDVVVFDPKAAGNARAVAPRLAFAGTASEAVRGAHLLLHLTEWAEFAEIAPEDLAPAHAQVLDARLGLNADRWTRAGWDYAALGRPSRPARQVRAVSPPDPSCVQVGFGTVAELHLDKWTELGVRVSAVVEADRSRHDRIRRRGLHPVTTIAEAAALAPVFWDVCAPTGSHATVIADIVARDPDANILVEKPVCTPVARGQLTESLRGHRGALVVNENYASSQLAGQVGAILREHRVVPDRLTVEMTKDRRSEMLAGRFVDDLLGVVGYEGSQLVTLAEDVCGGLPGRTGTDHGANWDGVALDRIDLDGVALQGAVNDLTACSFLPSESLERQGDAWVRFPIRDCAVTLRTAMDGRPRTRCPELAVGLPYRVLVAEGESAERGPVRLVAAQTAAAHAVPWNSVRLSDADGDVLCEAAVPDDSMRQHLSRALNHFTGTAANPYPLERALACLDFLHRWSRLPQQPEQERQHVVALDPAAVR